MHYLQAFAVTRRVTGQGGGHTVYYLQAFAVTRRVTGQGGGHTVYYLQAFASHGLFGMSDATGIILISVVLEGARQRPGASGGVADTVRKGVRNTMLRKMMQHEAL